MGFLTDLSDSEEEDDAKELPLGDASAEELRQDRLLFRLPSWDGREVSFADGEVVRITENLKTLRAECEKMKLSVNEKKTSFLGQQGTIVFVDGGTAKVKFQSLGESFFPLTCLRPLTDLPNNVKETIEHCFYRVLRAQSNSSPREKKKARVLTATQLCELLSISYPDYNRTKLEKLQKQWDKSHGMSLAGIQMNYSDIYARDTKEMSLIRQRLDDFLDSPHAEIQIGMVGAKSTVYLPLKKGSFEDVLSRVAAYESTE